MRRAGAAQHANSDERLTEQGSWPHALSHEPSLRVSDVLAQVGNEFPALTPSKLRFLDSNGLVSPHRTASGYRQYSPADVERLRFVLRAQRDHYRPLSVIADHLAALDDGRMHQAVTPHLTEPDSAWIDIGQLAVGANTDVTTIRELESAGMIGQAAPGRYERAILQQVAAYAAYLGAGGAMTDLKMLVRAGRREAAAVAAVARPARARGLDSNADAVAAARSDAAIAVFSASLHDPVDAQESAATRGPRRGDGR